MSYQKAIEQAKANAVYFGVAYVVFAEATAIGKWRVESIGRPEQVCYAVVMPDGTIFDSAYQTTVGALTKSKGRT